MNTNIELAIPFISAITASITPTTTAAEIPALAAKINATEEETAAIAEFMAAHLTVIRKRAQNALSFAELAATLWVKHEKEEALNALMAALVANRFDIGTIGGDYKVRHAILLAAEERVETVGDAREILRHFNGPLSGTDVLDYLTDNAGLRSTVAALAEEMWANRNA